MFMHFVKKASEYADAWATCPKYGIISVIMLIVMILSLLITLPTGYHGICRLIAPEWFAVKEIIEMFK